MMWACQFCYNKFRQHPFKIITIRKIFLQWSRLARVAVRYRLPCFTLTTAYKTQHVTNIVTYNELLPNTNGQDTIGCRVVARRSACHYAADASLIDLALSIHLRYTQWPIITFRSVTLCQHLSPAIRPNSLHHTRVYSINLDVQELYVV